MTDMDRHENFIEGLAVVGVLIFLVAALSGIVLLFVESAIWGFAGLAALGALMVVYAVNAP